ncbi:hypothetical protein CRG98_041304 [Punica granatum]|uniref:Uncharacterized protein n=1 Tax=Punica granatum TaxID=22663 RepID=A0A2I0I2U6_PUNGR|nr:hypothetical protein CRG98_041304 [Punica granatum]
MEPPRSCLLQPCRVHRATSLVPLARLLGLLTRTSLLSCTASSRNHLACASCNLPGLLTRSSLLSCTASSLSHLLRASCNLAGSANPCELSFLHRKFAEPPPSCLLQPCRVCQPVRVYFLAQQVRRATSLVHVATSPSLLTCASLLSCTTSSPSHLARASSNLAGSANRCEFIFHHRKFAEPPRSCLLQHCRVCHHAGASCNLTESANPCQFTFLHRKFAEPPPSCLLQPYPVCQPVRVHFLALQVRRTTTLVLLAILPGLLTLASLLSITASSSSRLARASCNIAGSANPYEFNFLHSKFAEPARSWLVQPRWQVRRATSLVPLPTLPGLIPVRVLFLPPQVHRATSLVPLARLLGLLTRTRLLSCTASSRNHLACASCNLAGSANPCELTFLHRKFAEPPRSCLFQPCRVSYPCEFYFFHRRFTEPPRSCLLQDCWVC